MFKKIAFIFAALATGLAGATTLSPIQLLNPGGSTSGQAIVSTGPGTAPTWSAVSATALAPIAANSVLGNGTGSSAAPTALTVPSCSATGSALLWTSSTGFGCATGYAPLASPTFTGTPAAPTAAAGTNTTQLASTAFVQAQYAAPPAVGNTTPNTGAFTTLSATSTVSGAGFSTYLASPPAIGGTAASTGKFTTLQATGLITPSSTAGIAGTTTNDNANAGSVGEYATNTTTATSLTSGTYANATSVSLTAGDWDVEGVVSFNPAGGTTISGITTGISTTSATAGAFGTYQVLAATLTTGSAQVQMSPDVRISVTSTTTVYLVARSFFGTSTMTADGIIRARRVR